VLNVVLRFVPTVLITVTAATAISAAIRPYSIAVAPSSFFSSLAKVANIGISIEADLRTIATSPLRKVKTLKQLTTVQAINQKITQIKHQIFLFLHYVIQGCRGAIFPTRRIALIAEEGPGFPAGPFFPAFRDLGSVFDAQRQFDHRFLTAARRPQTLDGA
jgi:hypothetical protein